MTELESLRAEVDRLTERNAWLESELGLTNRAAFLTIIMQRFGLTHQQARIVEALYATFPRPLSGNQLQERMAEDEQFDYTSKPHKTVICLVRRKTWPTFIETVQHIGWRLGEQAAGDISAMFAKVAA